MRGVVFALLITGCADQVAVGPRAADQERALTITWEAAYGMEREARPTKIAWWASDGCGEELDVTGQTIEGICASDTEGSNGEIYVRWNGSFTSSAWSRALVIWRQYLVTGEMTRPNAESVALITRSQAMLNGL